MCLVLYMIMSIAMSINQLQRVDIDEYVIFIFINFKNFQFLFTANLVYYSLAIKDFFF